MTRRLSAWWERVWFQPASPRSLKAVRVLAAAQALWILLSRPDLPEVVAWPREFWLSVDRFLPLRFGIVGAPLALERLLFLALHALLLAALAGLYPRAFCLVSALLLYHFAPFEEIFAGMPHTSFGGLTLPVLALFILSFVDLPADNRTRSHDYRWPLTLVRLLFSFGYLFPALMKLRYSGPAWFTAGNIHDWIVVNDLVTGAPLALWTASSRPLCWAIAVGTMCVELLFPLAAFSARAATILVPLAALFHAGITLTLGYFFPSIAMLLIYVDWDVAVARLRRAGPASEAPA